MKTLSDINFRDPYILSVPELEQYYLFGTDGLTAWSGAPHGFDVYISSDLQEWSGPIAAFRQMLIFGLIIISGHQRFTATTENIICSLLLKDIAFHGDTNIKRGNT